MFRKFLIATALIAASGGALAHGGPSYGRVVSVEPYVSIAFGTGRHDGFRVVYESGGRHYWTHSAYYPGNVIVVPPPHQVHYIHHYVPHSKPHPKHHHRHWRGDDRRGWDDRGGWDDPRHEHRRGEWR
ncbi:MAG: hypothetical protein ACK4UX_04715 [Thiobacillus sp.]